MSEHVSIETARKLQFADLAHEWAVGDWCIGGMSQQPLLVLETGLERAHFGPGEWLRVQDTLIYADRQSFVRAGAALWLPTAGQLLQELAKRGDVTCGTWDADGKQQRWYVGPFDLTVRDEEFTTGDSLAEAVAAVLLAVLQEGEVQL